MGQRGPLKGSKRLQVVRGGQGTVTTQAPKKPRAKRPTVPAWLPPEGRKIMREIIADLEETLAGAGGLKKSDGVALTALALHYAILKAATEAMTEGDGKDAKFNISTGDPDHKSEDGEAAIRKHPMLSVIASHSEKLKVWAAEFGMTHAARERLGIKPPKGASKLDRFTAGNKY